MGLNLLKSLVGYVWIMLFSVVLFQGETLGGDGPTEYVILLHGLARTKRSMEMLERHFASKGFGVTNVGYPSRSKTVQELAEAAIPKAVEYCRKDSAKKIHFVTHSMGGILVRYYLKHHEIPELGRVVMLSPPNGGSEIVDKYRNNSVFKWVNGPAGQQLGTDHNSIVKELGEVHFDLGVITGDRSVNPVLSFLIPGADDGKVSVENAKVNGMKDFIVIHATHPFIMRHQQAIEQATIFLKYGKFQIPSRHPSE